MRSARKRTQHADAISRLFLVTKPLSGVPFVEDGRLYLLSRRAKEPPDARTLARALLHPESAERASLAGFLGARLVTLADGSALSRWGLALARLEARRDLVQLADEGIPSVRWLRGVDPIERLRQARAALTRLLQVAERPVDETLDAVMAENPSPEELVAALPLRLLALGTWPLDSIEQLLEPEVDCDPALLHLASASRVPETAILAAVLLGQRVRARGGSGSPLLGRLPETLRAAFSSGLAPHPTTPVLLARWIAEGASRAPGPPVVVPEAARASRLALESVALLFGVPAASESARALSLAVEVPQGSVRPGRPERYGRLVEEQALAVSLLAPGTPLELPDQLSADAFETHLRLVEGLSGERVRELGSLFGRIPADRTDDAGSLARLGLSAHAVSEALRLGVSQGVRELADEPATVDRYLECVADVRRSGVWKGIDFEARWLVSVFRGDRAWAPRLALVFLSPRRSWLTDGPGSLHALARIVDRQVPELGRALAAWGHPVALEPHPELNALAEALDLGNEVLIEALHHSRLAGRGESFSAALLSVLDPVEEAHEREAFYLENRLGTTDLQESARREMERRVLDLRDPASIEGRRRDRARRERHRLKRSLEELRRESLSRTLQGVSRAALARVLGRSLRDRPLPPDLWHALQLLDAPRVDRALLRSFLDEVISGEPLRDRTENRRWLESAARAGVDTVRWLRGLTVSLDTPEGRVEVATERDPLEILRMGTYFGTCLNLDYGENAASTLANALDVNKQVLYGRTSDGAVVLRKLIGATAGGALAGYRTYGFAPDSATGEALRRALVTFADECCLTPSDTATPEILCGGFWYDDGNESWAARAKPAVEIGPVPDDREARNEWRLTVAAWRPCPSDLLENSVLESYSFAAARALCRTDPSAFVERELRLVDFGFRALALSESTYKLFEKHAGVRFGTRQRLRFLLEAMPLDVAVASRLPGVIRACRSARRGPQQGHWSRLGFPPEVGMLPPGEIVRGVTLISSFAQGTDLTEMVDALEVALLRDGDGTPPVRTLAAGPFASIPLAVELATRRPVPRLAGPLRQLLVRTEPDELEAVALALGTQGEHEDGPRLLALLRRRPGSVLLALAVVRTGNEDASNEARSLLVPSLPEEGSAFRAWLPLARELRSTRLVDALVRSIRRQLARGSLRGLDLSRHIGFPSILGVDPDATCGDRVPRSTLDSARALSRAVSQSDHALKLLRQGEPLAALGLWRERAAIISRHVSRLGIGDAAPAAITDARFEREIRRLAVTGDSPEVRDAALGAWMDLLATGPERHRLARLLGAALGPAAAELPADRRCQLAVTALGPKTHAAALTWMNGLSEKDLDGVLASVLARDGSPDREQVVDLLGHLPAESSLRSSIVRSASRLEPDQAVAFLQKATEDLDPMLAEEVCRSVLRRMGPRQIRLIDVSSLRLVEWIVEEALDSHQIQAALEEAEGHATARGRWIADLLRRALTAAPGTRPGLFPSFQNGGRVVPGEEGGEDHGDLPASFSPSSTRPPSRAGRPGGCRPSS